LTPFSEELTIVRWAFSTLFPSGSILTKMEETKAFTFLPITQDFSGSLITGRCMKNLEENK